VDAVADLFDTLIQLEVDRRRPPVMSWQPARTGHIDIRIAADGTWFHEGEPIRRAGLVKLFASILRRDPDGYCLVTPAEKLLIHVDDAPFLAVDMVVKGAGRDQSLLFLTNVEDAVIADAGHPLRLSGSAAEPRPYLMIRDDLAALLSRPVYYRLIDQAVVEGPELAVYSGGVRFVLGRH
jgi:hypothetical protein